MELSRRSAAAGFCEGFAKYFASGCRAIQQAKSTVARSPAAELATGAAEMSTAAYGCQPGDFCRELVIVRAL
jgi:hypothetical protein